MLVVMYPSAVRPKADRLMEAGSSHSARLNINCFSSQAGQVISKLLASRDLGLAPTKQQSI